MVIGTMVLKQTKRLIGVLIDRYQADINASFLKADGTLPVSIKTVYKTSIGDRGIEVEVSINFTADRIKDSIKGTILEGQQGLFDEECKKTEECREHDQNILCDCSGKALPVPEEV
jgi:hypothetical protein